MAHQFSSDKSDDQIPTQPLEVNTPHKPKDKNTKQKEEKDELGDDDSETSSSYGGTNNKIEEDSGRERLKRHRIEVGGRVWIPEIWGQEELLKDWIDSSVFDAPLLPTKILTARTALVQAATTSTPTNYCTCRLRLC